MTNKILLCTVGGSHEPVVKAIQSLSPDYVCFFCTDKDPISRKGGSRNQIVGKGNVIKTRPQAEKPSLPNIPTQASLQEDQFRVCTVLADDLDDAFLIMAEEAKKLADEYPGSSIFADYTGGTKTMSAALVCAALESPGVNLQLVTGSRSNLTGLISGAEQVSGAGVARLRFKREVALHLGAWRRFAYHEAAQGLDNIRLDTSSPGPDRRQLQNSRMLSHAFACWNNFDHVTALQFLQQANARRVSEVWPWMFDTLGVLSRKDDRRRNALCIYDLWRNAERCACQGRFDDAVARTYRLIEWTAQWQLRSKCEIDTANAPREKLPPDVVASPDKNGKIKIGLHAAWKVLAYHMGSPARELSGEQLHGLLEIRNQSILAHGFNPVQKMDWEKMKTWVEGKFLPILDIWAQEVRISQPLEQLPKELPVEVWQ